jgi:hypothetical protein
MVRGSITRRRLLQAGGAALVVAGIEGLAARPGLAVEREVGVASLVDAGLCVYGGTSAGVAAAVQFHRMGGTAVIVEPGNHLGGLSSGGLGQTDTGSGGAIGGISREFYRRVYAAYNGTTVTSTSPARFTFEPHVAEGIFEALVEEARVPVFFGARLASVTKVGGRITEITTANGQTFRAGVFVDATYEGDLMAGAGVAFTVGREANSTYGETINGVQLRSGHQFTLAVDPYRTPGVPSSGLLPEVGNGTLAPTGTGDGRIQAYCFRMCLTQAANRLPFPRPAGYDPGRYELLRRYIAAGYSGPFFSTHGVGNGKTDSNNNGAFSTDHIGANHGYPTGSLATRDAIFAGHVAYQQGFMYFLANDPGVPAAIRASVGAWGLPADEFTDTGGWPHQLYVREARRMVSAYVMSEHNCRGTVTVTDSVGLASYTMDSHNCQRLVVNGAARNEGDMQVGVPQPYPIAFRSIVPVEAQCSNLLVPVCLSASHIAYGSIRMEPVFMILGQSAATAAKLASDAGTSVQRVSLTQLQARLLVDGQVLSWPPQSLGEVILDNAAATGITRAGTWTRSTAISGYYGAGYEHDGNANKGATRLRFRPSLPSAGTWTVQLRWTAHPNRATNVPVDVIHNGGTTTRSINQRQAGGQWISLGSFSFAAGTTGSVLLRTDGTDGYVVADAVRFTKA